MIRLRPKYPTYILNTWDTPDDDEAHYIPITKVFQIQTGLFRTQARFSFGDSPQEVTAIHHDFRTKPLDYIKTKYFPTYFCKYEGKSFGAVSHPHEIIRLAKKYPAEGNIHPIAYSAFYYRYTWCVHHEGHGLLHMPHTRHTAPNTPCFQFAKGRIPKPTFTPCMAFMGMARERYVYTLSLGNIMATINIPLYLHHDFMGTTQRVPNITKYFTDLLTAKYRTPLSPDIIFGYIYSIMWHKHYRAKWASVYRNDLPNLPLVKSLDTFLDLASLGYRLYTLHLSIPNLPN